MSPTLLAFFFLQSPSLADDNEESETTSSEQKTKKKKKGGALPVNTKKKTPKKQPSTPSSNDNPLNTINPGGVKTPSQTHDTTSGSNSGGTTLTPPPAEKTPSTETTKKGNGIFGTSTTTRTTTKKRPRTTTSGQPSSKPTAAAGIAAAAVGLGALALIPTKTKKIKCPFDRARIGFRGGSQLSTDTDPFGGGLAVGYRFCNPIGLDLSYVHYGALEPNPNAPIQGSVKLFVFNSLLSGYLTGGMSLAGTPDGDDTRWLYGPHGGAGAQLLISTGKNGIAAVNLEGRLASYLNAEANEQQSQFQALLGLDFYF